VSSLADNGLVLNGYLDETLVDTVFFASLLIPVLAAIVLGIKLVRRKAGRLRAALLLTAAVAFFLAVTVMNVFLGTKLPYDTVFSRTRNTHFVLCDVLVPTDVVFEVATTASLWRPFWRLAFDSSILDYSEDGSLISNPRLRLSGDESILVVERGGELTDAIDLVTSTNLAAHIEFTRPDRQQAWSSRTRAINEILRAHLAQAR